MKILWMSWKDPLNPKSGGAERISQKLMRHLALNGHEVILITSNFKCAKESHDLNNLKIIRIGNSFTVYWKAYRYYKNNLMGWADLVIDEMNTIPFFCKLYTKEPNLLLTYQLCREIWFHQMVFPLSIIGYLLEPIYLLVLKDRFCITESTSTKNDLINHGFNPTKIHILPISIDDEFLSNYELMKCPNNKTLLSLGSIRPMKRTLDQILAFEIAKDKIPDLELNVIGDASTRYGSKVLSYIKTSRHKSSINYLGRLDESEKISALKNSSLIMVTSVKEGWGLIVTEANSQGTPAVVYDVDGLRDSVQRNITGLICEKNSPLCLAENIVELLENPKKYNDMKSNALSYSKNFTNQALFKRFDEIISNFLSDCRFQ